jgi:hypothetical protein
LLGPAAPISIGRFDRLVIAASNSVDYDYQLRPNGAHPDADEKIIWADLKVKHDGLGKRFEKIKRIVDFHGDEDYVLRVCSRSAFVDGKFNDNRCNKCFNTILRLILNGHDPNEHGFIAYESTWDYLKTKWGNRGFRTRRSRGWKNMQAMIPDQIDFDVNGSKEFFEWLRGLDIEVMERERYIFFTDLYMWLPFSLAEILRKVYAKLEIRTQGWGFNPVYARTLKQQKPDDN